MTNTIVTRTSSSHVKYYVAKLNEEGSEFVLDCYPFTNKPKKWDEFIYAKEWATSITGIVIAKEVLYGHPNGILLNHKDMLKLLD